MTYKYSYSNAYIPQDTELALQTVLQNKELAGHGEFNQLCSSLLSEYHGKQTLITPSCTASLEMAAMLCDLQQGDEVIMPSFTFVSTANAVVLRGAVPVFVDISHDTLNIDPEKILAAITQKTKAIVVVHYAGVGCEMDTIKEIAIAHGLLIIEDNAQGLGASYKGRKLGTFGDFSAISYHSTKNIIAGEGGSLTIMNDENSLRAEVIREKGTNRSQFFRGEIDKYSWVDIGSSYLLSEVSAAFLYCQLKLIDDITAKRLKIWNSYQEALKQHDSVWFQTPRIPPYAQHNGHIFYVLLDHRIDREKVIAGLRSQNIQATSHYVPLHSSDYGRKVSRASGNLSVTNTISERILRLPTWVGLTDEDVDYICSSFVKVLSDQSISALN